MHYIYVIQSIQFPELTYVGYTTDVDERLYTHNTGGSIYTSQHKPWKLIWHCIFENKYKALEFEKYLKTHSGRAFLHKRLI
jgi:predicted GIY-YIG superfamily endonuclease